MMYQFWNTQQLYTFINSTGWFKKMTSHQKRIRRSITTTDKTSSAGSKKIFDPELQSFTKRTHRFDISVHRQNSKHQKLTIESLCLNIMKALDIFYSDDQSGFYSHCKDFLSRGIDSWKLNIVERMNTYEYIGMAMARQPYVGIETEIIKEWKKNHLLFAIMTYWYSAMQKTKFHSLKEFQAKYDIYRDFISQITYLIFKGWLGNWQKRMQKKNIRALEKLYDETCHYIITDSNQFKKVYEKVIIPLIDRQMGGRTINWNFDLRELNVEKKCVFDLQSEENLPKTMEALMKFSKQTRIQKKIQLLRQYRLTLDTQMRSQQEEIQKRQNITRCQVLEKDDYISAIIYCLIKGHIAEIQYSTLYLTTLLGKNMEILSKMQLNAYATDIIAVVDFLTVSSLEVQDLQERAYFFNVGNQGSMKIVKKSNQVEDPEFQSFILGKIPNMTIKQTTSVEEKWM